MAENSWQGTGGSQASSVRHDQRNDAPLPRYEVVPLSGSRARLVRLSQGLYAVRVGPSSARRTEQKGMALPATLVTPAPGEREIEVFTSRREAATWLTADGGAFVVRVGGATGCIVVTTLGENEADVRAGSPFEILKLDDGLENVGGDSFRVDAPPARTSPPPPDGGSRRASSDLSNGDREPALAPRREGGLRDVTLDVVLHIERAGDKTFAAAQDKWLGNPGKRIRVEGLSITPKQVINPADLEYKTVDVNGRETDWMPGGTFAGTRRKGLPIIGFAARLNPPARDLYEVVYSGQFFERGESGVARDGEICRSVLARDPLSALKLSVRPRVR